MKHFVNLLIKTYIGFIVLSIIFSLGWQLGALIFVIIFEACYCLTEEEKRDEQIRNRLKGNLKEENEESE